MGNFAGHVLPGSMFLVFGLWWSWGVAHARHTRRPLPMRVALPSTPGRLPLDPLLRLGLAAFGACVEVHSALGYPRLSVADVQHVAMYSVFALAAAADLLIHYRFPIPKGTDYFLSALCFLSEGLLFFFHIQHQGHFEQQVSASPFLLVHPPWFPVHALLLVAVGGCLLATILEAFNPQSMELKLHRAFWIIVQGTWFYQAAFLIYNPVPGSAHPWSSGGGVMEDGMWASVFFVAHCLLAVLVQAALSIPALHSLRPPHPPVYINGVTHTGRKEEEEVNLLDSPT